MQKKFFKVCLWNTSPVASDVDLWLIICRAVGILHIDVYQVLILKIWVKCSLVIGFTSCGRMTNQPTAIPTCVKKYTLPSSKGDKYKVRGPYHPSILFGHTCFANVITNADNDNVWYSIPCTGRFLCRRWHQTTSARYSCYCSGRCPVPGTPWLRSAWTTGQRSSHPEDR